MIDDVEHIKQISRYTQQPAAPIGDFSQQFLQYRPAHKPFLQRYRNEGVRSSPPPHYHGQG